ncbi:MAG: ECF transporter S component [Bacilli bacterium]|jgi:uncharacterized membrane protein
MKLTVRQMTLAALLTALTFVLTAFVHVPLSIGYFNLGDIIVLFSAIFIHPIFGAFVGAIGASLADLYGGYLFFIPFTIGAKALEAIVAGYLFRKIKTPYSYGALLIGAALMVATYAVSYLIFDPTGAMLAATIPFDSLQGLAGATGAALLYIAIAPHRARLRL